MYQVYILNYIKFLKYTYVKCRMTHYFASTSTGTSKIFVFQIYGMYLVKLAIVVVLAGGSCLQADDDTGTRIRTEPHLLLVGDPGTGKSQLLKYCSKIIPRSILTTGIGSTSSGLTVAAIMVSSS